MKKQLFLILISVLFFGCKKEISTPNIIDKNNANLILENGRLKINTISSFNSLVKEAYQNENNLKFLQEKFSEEFSNKFVSFEMKKEEQISNSQVKLNSNTQTTQEPLIEKLVPDPIFASILNENGEIQVENTIYKVTKYGTFMVPSTKIKKLDSLIVLWNSKTTSNQTNTQSIGTQSINPIREFSPYDDAVMIENSFYSIKPDIYLYDTYGYTNGNNPDFYEADEIQSGFNSPDFLSNFVSEPVEYSSIWSTSNSLNTSPNLNLITTNSTLTNLLKL